MGRRRTRHGRTRYCLEGLVQVVVYKGPVRSPLALLESLVQRVVAEEGHRCRHGADVLPFRCFPWVRCLNRQAEPLGDVKTGEWLARGGPEEEPSMGGAWRRIHILAQSLYRAQWMGRGTIQLCPDNNGGQDETFPFVLS